MWQIVAITSNACCPNTRLGCELAFVSISAHSTRSVPIPHDRTYAIRTDLATREHNCKSAARSKVLDLNCVDHAAFLSIRTLAAHSVLLSARSFPLGFELRSIAIIRTAKRSWKLNFLRHESRLLCWCSDFASESECGVSLSEVETPLDECEVIVEPFFCSSMSEGSSTQVRALRVE